MDINGDVFRFAEFRKLKYLYHTIDTYPGFQFNFSQIKTDNAPVYASG